MPDSSHSALLLTHRRGGIVCLFRPEHFVEKNALHDHLMTFFSTSTQTPHDGFEMVSVTSVPSEKMVSDTSVPAVVVAMSTTTTGERLRDMYTACLRAFSISDKAVSHFYFGTGPGSFTGLRLGCAFLNGLTFARERCLFEFPNALRTEILANSMDYENVAALKHGLETLANEDEFSVYTSPVDLLFAARKWKDALAVQVLEPRYGRLPGPVLKLNLGL